MEKHVVWVKIVKFGRGRGGKPVFLARDGGETKDITKAKIIDPYYDGIIGARRAYAKKVGGKLVPYELIDEPKEPWKKISKVGEIPDETTDYENRIIDIYDSVRHENDKLVKEKVDVINKYYYVEVKDFIEKSVKQIEKDFEKFLRKYKAIPEAIVVYSEDYDGVGDVVFYFDEDRGEYDISNTMMFAVHDITTMIAGATGEKHSRVIKKFEHEIEKKLEALNKVAVSFASNYLGESANITSNPTAFLSVGDIVFNTPKEVVAKFRNKANDLFDKGVSDVNVGFFSIFRHKNFVFEVKDGVLNRNRKKMKALVDEILYDLMMAYVEGWRVAFKNKQFTEKDRAGEFVLTLDKMRREEIKSMLNEIENNGYEYIVVVSPNSLKEERIDVNAIARGDKKEIEKANKALDNFWKEAEKILRQKYTAKLEKIFDALQDEINALYRYMGKA